MLLTNMRKGMKKILWITLILIIPSFVAWGIGSRGGREKNIAAKVNRRTISLNEYGAVINRYYEYYKKIYKDEFNEEVAEKLNFKKKALNDLIKDILLSSEAKRNHIKTVRPEDIEKNIKEDAFFKNEQGEFDPEKYDFFIKNCRASNWEKVKEAAKRELIAEEVSQRIKDSFKITEEELRNEFQKENELVKTRYIRFSPSQYVSNIKLTDEDTKTFYEKHKKEFEKPESINIEYLAVKFEDIKKDITVTQEEIKKYYEDHGDEFHKPEEIQCRHVLMRTPPDASPEKINSTLKQFDFMMNKYKEDVTFETLARVYSEDYKTRADGGDLGYFKRGTMAPEFEDAAFKLKKGEVSKVVKTSQGYHIIKLEDRRPAHDETLEEASPDIKEKLLDERTKAKAEEKAKEIYNEVYDAETLISASKKYNIALEESGFFAAGEEIKGLGQSYKIWKTAFQLEEDATSELIEASEGYAIFKLKEKKPPYIPELEDVKKDVENRIKEEKAKDMAKEKAEECLKELQSKGDFKEAAKKFQVEIRDPEPFNREGYLKRVDYSKDFGKVCFNLKKDECGGVVETRQGFYIFKLVEKIAPDMAEFEEAKDELRKRLLQQKAYYLYDEWYENLKKQAKIKTYL